MCSGSLFYCFNIVGIYEIKYIVKNFFGVELISIKNLLIILVFVINLLVIVSNNILCKGELIDVKI